MPPRSRLTARGRLLVGVTAVVLASALVVTVLVVLQRPRLLGQAVPALADCSVSSGDVEVGMTSAQAEAASAVAARSVRLQLPRRTTAQALSGELGLSAEEAPVVAAALRGAEPASLSCRHGGADDDEPDALDGRGLTGRAAAVRADLLEAFGDLPLGGFAPGGVSEGHMPGSAHYEGRAVDVFFRPVEEANLRRGWAVAHYLVAHAERLGVDTVIFDRQIWTARRAIQGWRDYEPDTSGRPPAVAEILEHRDHVHVDVGD